MKKHVIGKLALAVIFAVSNSAMAANRSAAQARSDAGFVGEMNLEFGGDEIAQISFVDGSTQKIRTGQGVGLNGGGHFRPAGWDVDFSGTLGYKYVTTKATNADINIGRVTFKLLATYDPFDSWWVGAGPEWHMGTKYDGDGFTPNVKFQDSVGLTIRVGWRWVGLSYTNMEYKVQSTGRKVDASSIGLLVWWRG